MSSNMSSRSRPSSRLRISRITTRAASSAKAPGTAPERGRPSSAYPMAHRSPATATDGPGCKALPDGDHSDRSRLDREPARDQSLAAHWIRKRARAHLAGSPHKRIESDKHADLHQGQSPLSEEQRKQSPGHSVVEVA